MCRDHIYRAALHVRMPEYAGARSRSLDRSICHPFLAPRSAASANSRGSLDIASSRKPGFYAKFPADSRGMRDVYFVDTRRSMREMPPREQRQREHSSSRRTAANQSVHRDRSITDDAPRTRGHARAEVPVARRQETSPIPR